MSLLHLLASFFFKLELLVSATLHDNMNQLYVHIHAPSLLDLLPAPLPRPPLWVITEQSWAPSTTQQLPTSCLFYMWCCLLVFFRQINGEQKKVWVKDEQLKNPLQSGSTHLQGSRALRIQNKQNNQGPGGQNLKPSPETSPIEVLKPSV